MQDDPSMARVLYGDVVKDEGHEQVQKFGRELLSRMDNAGMEFYNSKKVCSSSILNRLPEEIQVFK
jgi:hypothetical protein